MRLRKVISFALAVSLLSATLTGCGDKPDDQTWDEYYNEKEGITDSKKEEESVEGKLLDSDKKDYTTILEDGTYYIRHSDGRCDPVYYGEAAFDKDDQTSSANDNRVMWFRSDYDKIPTFYTGDELILYSTSILPTLFYFERFEDFGFSVGLRKIDFDDNGRLIFPTDEDAESTYPNSETDVLLDSTNTKIIIDSVGTIRTTENSGATVTRVGSLVIPENFLGQDISVIAYDGTIRHEYEFPVNVKILGSMDVRKSRLYDFDEGNIIVINVPSEFNTGYYCVNGNGMFRYVKGNSYDDSKTDFNVPNIYDDNAESEKTTIKEMDKYTGSDMSEEPLSSDPYAGMKAVEKADADTPKVTFTVTNTGGVSVNVTFTNPDGTPAENVEMVDAYIVSPINHAKYLMSNNGNSVYRDFEATEKGEYEIKFSGLNGLVPKVSAKTSLF